MSNCARCVASLDGHYSAACNRDYTARSAASWQRECAAMAATADEMDRRSKLFADLCLLLHLDPERATADDVLRLVGECVDRATEAEWVAGQLERMREKRDQCAYRARRWRWWIPRYLLRDHMTTRRQEREAAAKRRQEL